MWARIGPSRGRGACRRLEWHGSAAPAREALAFSSEAEASDVPETSQHKQHDIRHVLPHEQICDGHVPCGLGSGELPASRPGRRPVPREDTLRAHARACLLKGSCSRGASKFSRSTCNAEQRSWSHSAVVFFGLRRHPPMSRGAPVFHQLAYLTADPTAPTG